MRIPRSKVRTYDDGGSADRVAAMDEAPEVPVSIDAGRKSLFGAVRGR